MDILHQLHQLGVTVGVSGDKVRLEPGSRVPKRLLEALRKDKAEVLAYLKEHQDWVAAKYGLRYSSPDRPGADELEEIERRVARNGYVLLWSTELDDLVAFYNTDEDRRLIPPGFIAYSEQELRALFGTTDDLLLESLRLIHHAKKLGAEVIGNNEEADPE